MSDWTKNPSIQNLSYPDDGHRVETGVVRFGEDWPAIHIRGDNALGDAMRLETIAEEIKVLFPRQSQGLRRMASFLKSCSVKELESYSLLENNSNE